MATDVNTEIIFVSFVTEKCIRLLQQFRVKEITEPVQLSLLVCQAPGLEIKIEYVIVNDVLFDPVGPADEVLPVHVPEPRVITPPPYFR